ncbi:MAG: type II/IV secretion system protein [Magnetococcales bacterium]|nr:type II/IV secretion system protein [Magnetococcales bacterium]MBF0438672.1 type II/IV secretion system protein [Magnetococcales bacterium]
MAEAEKATKQIGELLKEKGLINDSQIELALQDQKVTRERVGEILERLGFISQYDIATTIADQDGRKYVDVDQKRPAHETLRLFNLNGCLTNKFLPYFHDDKVVFVATYSDDVEGVMKIISRATGLKPQVRQGEKSKIINAIQYYYYFLENPVETLIQKEIQLLAADRDGVRSLDSFVVHLLQLAVKARASDVHIRPMDKSISVAFRVDGVMRAQFALPLTFKRLISTLKMKASMDIAEQRLPQDGSFSETILNNQFDFRVSSTVCPYGENLVLRLLPAKGDFMGMRQLGVFEEDLELLTQIFNEPFGIVLLTGPTGSGKTTTLYAAVRRLNLTEKNILTVENPIEYRIPLIRQTQINIKAGYTFANAIRFFLRHDPDVILVGEIRDPETAQTAVSASETGHLVLSTLHTNTAFGAIPRLRSLGIPNFMLADSLVGVVSQRLVRKICPGCKEEYTPTPDELAYLKDTEILSLWRGRGCEHCHQSGYMGRTLIYEILRSNREIKGMIGRDVDVETMEQAALKDGFRTIFDNAVRKVKLGQTTVKEVIRVLGH